MARLALSLGVAAGISALVPLTASGGEPLPPPDGFERFGEFGCGAMIMPGSVEANMPPVRPCMADEETLLSAGSGSVSAQYLHTETDTNVAPESEPMPGDRVFGSAFADRVKVGSAVIDDAMSVSQAGCRIDGRGNFGPFVRSDTSVKSITFGSGPPIPVGTGHTHFGNIHLNHHQKFVNDVRTLTVDRSVWVKGAGVKVESRAAFYGDPCLARPIFVTDNGPA